MQGSARKDVVFGAARMYTVAVPGPKRKSWLRGWWDPKAEEFCPSLAFCRVLSASYDGKAVTALSRQRTLYEGVRVKLVST